MDILTRIIEVIEETGLSRRKFEMKIGKSPGYFHMMEKQKSKPSIEIIISILQEFPQYNLYWLVMGIGPKYLTGSLDEKQNFNSRAINPTVENIVDKHCNQLKQDLQGLLEKK